MLTLTDAHLPKGWHVIKSLELAVEEDPDNDLVYVSDDVFRQYGMGETEVEALVDYGRNLTEFFEIIAAGDNVFDARTLDRLQTYLRK